MEAFWRSLYFLRQLTRYGRELDQPPQILPYGWAAALHLYDSAEQLPCARRRRRRERLRADTLNTSHGEVVEVRRLEHGGVRLRVETAPGLVELTLSADEARSLAGQLRGPEPPR